MLGEAWHAMGSNRMRTVLTMLGMVIGVSSVVLMTAIGQGAQYAVAQTISTMGSNLYVIISGSTHAGGVRSGGGFGPTLRVADAEAIAELDDVINVAGHRLGTREIEEAIQGHPGIAEVAVVGVADQLKGQIPMAFAVVKDAGSISSLEKRIELEKAVFKQVDDSLGAIARPSRVHFLTILPKTRSGKIMRRLLRAIAKGEEITQDVSTLENPAILEQLKQSL